MRVSREISGFLGICGMGFEDFGLSNGRVLLDARAMSITTGSSTEVAAVKPAEVVVRGNATGFLQEIIAGRHHLQADEPASVSGNDAAPGPYDYLLMALGSCTSMTVGLYARRKQIPLETITVSLSHGRIHAKDCESCETKAGLLDQIDLRLELTGNLTTEQRQKLIEIAGKCPIHRTLTSEIDIRLHAD